jgi:hypothetical protein
MAEIALSKPDLRPFALILSFDTMLAQSGFEILFLPAARASASVRTWRYTANSRREESSGWTKTYKVVSIVRTDTFPGGIEWLPSQTDPGLLQPLEKETAK